MKIIFLVILTLFVSGCENKKCIKGHKEQTICIMAFPNGKGGVMSAPIPCIRKVCDEWEKVVK